MKTTAIVLSAGKGKRMNSDIPKQYMPLLNHPVIYYALKAFEDSVVDEIILVAGADDFDYLKREIIEEYSFKKVTKIVTGGAERYNSVNNGLLAADPNTDYVFIHDGARPLITPEMVSTLLKEVKEKKAVVAACPAKDTIKVVDANGKVVSTPDRKTLWQIQTPQVFEYALVKQAYAKAIAANDTTLTDDAMVVETYSDRNVYTINTGSGNLKITTPEDILMAEILLEKS